MCRSDQHEGAACCCFGGPAREPGLCMRACRGFSHASCVARPRMAWPRALLICGSECTPSALVAGVEHLLRNVKDATISTLSTDVSAKLQALKGLKSRLLEIQEYLGLVMEGKLPVNHDILNYLQVRRGAAQGLATGGKV